LVVIQVAHSTPTTVRLRSRMWFMGASDAAASEAGHR
jgi:hypothetical protein